MAKGIVKYIYIGTYSCSMEYSVFNYFFFTGMICFPAQLRRANSVDSFVVPLLPTAQSVMSVASTNGRSLSLESIPVVDTVPLLRRRDQPNNLTSNYLAHSSKNNKQSDSSGSESSLSETERKESESTVQVSTNFSLGCLLS